MDTNMQIKYQIPIIFCVCLLIIGILVAATVVLLSRYEPPMFIVELEEDLGDDAAWGFSSIIHNLKKENGQNTSCSSVTFFDSIDGNTFMIQKFKSSITGFSNEFGNHTIRIKTRRATTTTIELHVVSTAKFVVESEGFSDATLLVERKGTLVDRPWIFEAGSYKFKFIHAQKQDREASMNGDEIKGAMKKR